VQQAKYNLLCLSEQQTQYSMLLHKPAVHITNQTSPFCMHFKSHHYATEEIMRITEPEVLP
jgi:hypothetical protein